MRPDKYHPLHWLAAKTVYWAIFGPLVVVAAPFVLFGSFVSWLEWKACPWFADLTQPIGYHWHGFARAVGNAVLGYKPPQDDDFDFDNEYDEPDDDGEYEDCGLMADGQCTKAGSEECDWICGALDRLNDDCCPACGACPGFIGAECDETCEHAQKPD